MKRNAQALSWGTGIGTLGGLIGLGGAEFRLPVLAGIFHFRMLDAIVINLLVSLVTVVLTAGLIGDEVCGRMRVMRFFNTEGPVDRTRHYCLPPLQRLDLDEVLLLIEQQKYFLLHALRQTGKTSCLLALADHLNREGRYRAVYANFEVAFSASCVSHP